MTTLNVIKTTEVEDYVNQLADRLEENYKQYHIRMAERCNSDYSKKQLESIKNGTANLMRFNVIEGRKYWKIFSYEYDDYKGEYKQSSINCFVDKKTGDVFKPASYNKPAKHVRYNLLDEDSRANCLLRADWAGGYLYLKWLI